MWTPRRIRGRAHGLMVRLGGVTARALGGAGGWFERGLDFSGKACFLRECHRGLSEECDRRLTKLAETVVNVDAEAHSRSGLCRWILWVDLSAMLCGSVKKHEDCVCLMRERWCFF
jgi:hypothetical protein